ncbi:ferric reductase-like transmembrane domain-containing protein [Ancylomarina sp. 16SWW S1-10-2]|uniref:ferric reductase-like transmembrane domain-containing protein n=1 Tax=Ancylomarina sp. 16SWW S1-10-2 TaxID=2499681 RepID=UPI0012AE735F|nr:ferric reductase-like transmembrane domain-containing protein [Ancylomarina sp. 16SWW S1-10-2]MRT93524.1 FAD/NAD(P)-binding:oxidoreductase [Ancylomarina sp. 16SWW S1-10-2]
MENRIRLYNGIAAAAIFLGLPILFFVLGDFPERSILKNGLSLLTIIAFCMMLAQFYLARSNKNILKAHKMGKIVKYHKFIGYTFIAILFFHPFLIMLPRYFEAGVDPIDAFTTIITTFDSTGVILGIIAWCLMLVIGISSLIRNNMGMTYKTWRVFHGILSIAFLVIASWHVIDLGRHINSSMTIYIIILAGIGILLLLKTYFIKSSKPSGETK